MNWIEKIADDFLRARGYSKLSGGTQSSPMVQSGYGGNDSFQPPEYVNYIATSNGVYACSTLRAELLSSLPMKLYKLRGEKKREVTTGNLYTLLQKVNPFWTLDRLIAMSELSDCLFGEVFWFVERGPTGKGRPREIWWARPDRVQVVPHPDDYISHFMYTPPGSGRPIRYEKTEVIWIPRPNPINEFEGLSPLAAARLAADYTTVSMQTNLKLFENGIMMGGMVVPKGEDNTFSPEQAEQIEKTLEKRFKGKDKAHRWAVFRIDMEMKSLAMSPTEAQFIEGMKWSLDDICRAYKVPPDLVGGQRTYENVNAAYKGVWTNAVIPAGKFLASGLIEQLLPMFPGEADLLEFDATEIEVLQEAKSQAWTREKEQISAGAITINEWRADQGLERVEWGDVFWKAISLEPVDSAEAPRLLSDGTTDPTEEPPPVEGDTPPEEDTSQQQSKRNQRIVFGSEAHRQIWSRYIRRTEREEQKVGKAAADLFLRQKDSIIDRLKSKGRTIEEAAAEPFDQAQWLKAFREAMRPVIRDVVLAAGAEAYSDLAITAEFDVQTSAVITFIERRAQRFAKEVNDTTYQMLKDSLAEGIKNGEGINELADRVEAVMGARIESSYETIARTEVIGAYNGGTLAAWKQSEIVVGKTWLAALDDRTRTSHQAAHGQTRKLEEDFEVGSGRGPAPGQMGSAQEDINCRCVMNSITE